MFARRIVFAISVVLNLVLVYNLIWGDRGIIAYKDLKARCATLQSSLDQIHKDNHDLSQEIRLLQSDDKYLEKVIRNRMNFVRENETLYIYPTGQQAEQAGVSPDERKD